MAAIEVASKSVVTTKTVVQMLVGAVAGGALGYGVMTLAGHLHVSPKTMTWADFLGYWLGVTLFGVGLVLFAISFNRRELAESIEGRKAKLPATDGEVRLYRLQATTFVLAGAMVLLLLLSKGSLTETRQSQWMVFAAVAVLFVLQTIVNVLVWRGSDEFLKGQLLLTGAITFAIGQGALFLWAAAEKLHLARPVTSWETITLLLTLYLATGSYIGIRNRPGC